MTPFFKISVTLTGNADKGVFEPDSGLIKNKKTVLCYQSTVFGL
jgi:hypothetical protein